MRHFSGDSGGIRLLMDDELEQISGGEGEDTDDIATGGDDVAGLLNWLFTVGVGAVSGFLANQASTAFQRENVVGSMFDPSQAVQGTTWQSQGGLNYEVPSWTMPNGDLFVGTNRNGKPHMILRTDPAGSVYRNDGSGWTMIYSAS
mgnify:CR=1 FL=1